MEYIEGTKDPADNRCFLCVGPEADDEASLVIARKPKAFMIMNKFPYANGHVMVVPFRHVGRIEELTDEELLDMTSFVRVLSTVLTEALNADGINVGINMGRAAGAGLEQHLHIHVVPRWFGDTNFMPVIGETKVISEHLRATYLKLREKVREKLL
ncbi:MAG: HIT domain-containing protein [Syntrophorhabdales bacterium]|jgi:ATP adenylyltransferase